MPAGISIYGDVRDYINSAAADEAFTKRDIAEDLWPEWKHDGLAATNDWRCFLAYIGNLVLWEKQAGNIVEVDENSRTGAKYYKRVVKAPPAFKTNTNLQGIPTSELVAELNRRFG